MITIKKTNFLLSFSAALMIGIVLGYIIAGTKPPVTKIQYLNNTDANVTSNATIERKVENVNLTAKEALNLANLEAFLWADDAYLSEINLASKEFDSLGFSNGWKIIFYSEKNNKFYEILIKDGESRGGKEKDSTENIQTLKGEMIDSVKMAESFFSSHTDEKDIISLKMYYSDNAKKFIWTIFYSGGSHTIDAELQ